MAGTASMRELRNHTRQVIDRAQHEAVTITDAGVPVAVLTALNTPSGGWNADAWLDLVLGPDWTPYESGLADELAADRRAGADEPDGIDRLRGS